MTTNELKSYIDRILGNSVRLLLPSYWWKRAFGAVIDKVDEVDNKVKKKLDATNVKTINGESIVGEGDIKVSSGALKVWLWDEELGIVPTEEQIAENIATYNKLLEGSHSGVILCLGENLPSGEKVTTSINVDAQAIEAEGESYVVLQGEQPKMPNSNDMQTFSIQLNADGTMVISFGEDSLNGPLRVWWDDSEDGSTLSEEQKANNARVREKLVRGELSPVVLVSSSDFSTNMLATLQVVKTQAQLDISYLVVIRGTVTCYTMTLKSDGTYSIALA